MTAAAVHGRGAFTRRLALLAAVLTLFVLPGSPAGRAAWAQAAAGPQASLPVARGLPVLVQVSVAIVKLDGFDEGKGAFDATVDLRLRWQDGRLASPDAAPGAPPVTLREAEAEARLGGMWTPQVVLANVAAGSEARGTALRLHPDGNVELIRRTRGTFSTAFDVERFPFDRQALVVNAAALALTADLVALRFDQSDIDFSRPAPDLSLLGWSVGAIDLNRRPIAGWYNGANDQVVAALGITRDPGLVVAAIFIPLLASLVIPLLTIWLNSMKDGVLQIETFELVNIIIGGLFAVIALNFTVYSSYTFLSTGDNTVTRLFALNYVTLAIALMVNVLFSRFRVPARLFGVYVQEQAYVALMWAVPTLVLFTAAAFILNAMV